MKFNFFVLSLLFVLIVNVNSRALSLSEIKLRRSSSNENLRPIIGILTQPAPSTWMKPNRTTYLAASYVKYIEATGAQVVPIRMYQSIDYYNHLLSSLNGILFPGGDLSDEYLYTANLFYKWSIELFDNNKISFPIWGTCLGFEVLLMLTKGSVNVLDTCKGYDFATNINFTPKAANSRLLGPSLPSSVENALKNESTTSNFHNFCMRPDNFTADPILPVFYKSLSTSNDLDGRPFVSTIESNSYPIFGVQWHPEKNGFEWRINSSIPHSKSAIDVMQYVANFFTEQARQNDHHFDSLEDELRYLIYQYTPEFFGLDQSHFQQLYFFYEST